MSISMRFNVLRAIMAVEINEKFAALAVDIDRQFDELAAKYEPMLRNSLGQFDPTAGEGDTITWNPKVWMWNETTGQEVGAQQAAYHRAMEAQNQFCNQFGNALDAQAGLFNYGTRPYYPIN